MTPRSIILTATFLGLSAAPSFAQTGPAAKTGCSQPPVEAATPVTKGDASGSAPSSAGSTGWSGAGLGGSFTGTSQAGPLPSSPSFQPVTAKGLDPIKGMASKPSAC